MEADAGVGADGGVELPEPELTLGVGGGSEADGGVRVTFGVEVVEAENSETIRVIKTPVCM